MRKLFIFFPVMIMAITACSNDQPLSMNTGMAFFQYIDQKNFDQAYNLISDEDKQYFTAAEFSRSMENFYKHMYYPPGLDNESRIIISKIPADMIEKYSGRGISYFKENKKVFVVREVRKVPDIKAIKSTLGDQNNITGKMILDVLVTGRFPMTLDSSRFAIIAIEKGKPRVVIGTRYVKAYESLLQEYEVYLKQNLVISIVGKGFIYRTPANRVLGVIKYNLTNTSTDTLSALSVRGEFKGRFTSDTILYASSLKGILPHQTITDQIVFSDPFLLIILGYYYNRMNVKADITISHYPVGGDGPYFDSLMNSTPNAAITEFINPIIQGAGGF
jgi:hypothetical protein